MKEEFDFESIKNKAIEQLKSGKSLLGKDGAFAPLLESIWQKRSRLLQQKRPYCYSSDAAKLMFFS